MNRRRLLSLLGVGTVTSVASCRSAKSIPGLARWADRVVVRLSDGLSSSEQQLIAAIADITIPRTDTPGAADAGVPAFIEHMLSTWYTIEERRAAQLGLRALNRQCRTEQGDTFLALGPSKRLDFLSTLDGRKGPSGSAEDALAIMKRLTIHGYLTSELVQTKVLKIQTVPGRFDGCMTEPA